jgi:hypothetical protein
MRRDMRARFWVESALGVLSAVLLLVTALWPDWIEHLFEVQPDGGGGELEWLIAAALALAAIVAGGLARAEWRRARPAV